MSEIPSWYFHPLLPARCPHLRSVSQVSHDPAHLISAFDEADESDGTRSTMHKSLSQELAGPEDVTMSSSLNVCAFEVIRFMSEG